MDTSKCPVCGNPGIPDYLKEDVICPHCGSDLKVYKTLSEAAAERASKSTSPKFKLLAIVLPILVALLIGIPACLFYSNAKKSAKTALEIKDSNIAELQDSLSILSTKIVALEKQDKVSTGYIVVKNDSPWSIVRKIYGVREDWNELARQIGEANGILDENTGAWKQIHPGQVLKIEGLQ